MNTTATINLHKSDTRGAANFGWLDAKHSFSFGSYFNPKRMGFGALRVLNDDVIAPTKGFDTHPHQDMEIVSIPLRGTLTHKDSLGNSGDIEFGEVQAMSAGTGVRHSEYNLSRDQDVNLLQIWILPEELGLTPAYDQKRFERPERENSFQLVASRDGRNGSVKINQRANFHLFTAINQDAQRFDLDQATAAGQAAGIYLFVISGAVELQGEFEGVRLSKRDAAEISNSTSINFTPEVGAELLFIQVPLVEA